MGGISRICSRTRIYNQRRLAARGTDTLYTDIPVCLAIALIAVIPAIITRKLHLWQSVVMITGYIGYLVFMCI